MSLSNTAPLAARGDDRDPLYTAWRSLQEARGLPWESSCRSDWGRAFHERAMRAWLLVSRHVSNGKTEGLLLRGVVHEDALPDADLRRQLDEHAPLLGLSERLVEDAATSGDFDLPRIVDLCERAAMLEIRIAIHQNRLRRLLGSGRRGPAAAAAPAKIPARARAGSVLS